MTPSAETEDLFVMYLLGELPEEEQARLEEVFFTNDEYFEQLLIAEDELRYDYAQESLGDIVFVDMPKVGTEITAGKTFGTVESVKAVSDLFAPASGTVTEVNGELATSPEKVNKDAHGSWMVKIKLKDPGELNGLLSSPDYEKFVSEEAGH